MSTHDVVGAARAPDAAPAPPAPVAPDSSLAALRRAAGLPDAAGDDVRIDGGDPLLRTVYRVADAGAVSIAASAMAAAWLWRLRGGAAQAVRVDAVAAAAAMQSFKFLRLDGRPPGPVMDPLTGFRRCRDDRWIYLHCNFPNLAARNAAVLGVAADADAMQAAVARRDGAELEAALQQAGGCGALVRTEAEWRALPQALAAAAEPPLMIDRIGDAPPEPLPRGDRPLAGVRVLDLTRVLAGPTCAKTLAEHGADVLRITGPGLPDSGVLDIDTGIGKRAAQLDLRTSEGAAALRALVAGADVFSQSYRPGALDARGFGPEDLATLRPGLVYVTLSAWGHDGPWQRLRGYDTVVQSANGMALSSGAAEPAFLPVSAQDYVAGYLMAFGAMVALARRATEGGSWRVRVSLAACGEWIRSHGRFDDLPDAPEQVPADRVASWLLTRPGADGRAVTQLGPIARLSETPGRWEVAAGVALPSTAPR